MVIDVLTRNLSEILLSESMFNRESMAVQLFEDRADYGGIIR